MQTNCTNELFICFFFKDFISKMERKCETVVNTPSGEFTFYDEVMYRFGAKKFCKEQGAILAPITNRRDMKAVKEAAHNKECPFHRGAHIYNLGLDITPCGYKKQDRVFSNGVKWDELIHGPLYEVHDTTLRWPCNYAGLFTNEGKNGKAKIQMMDFGCVEEPHRFICFKPASDNSEPLTGTSTSVGSVWGIFLLGVFLLMLAFRKVSRSETR